MEAEHSIAFETVCGELDGGSRERKVTRTMGRKKTINT